MSRKRLIGHCQITQFFKGFFLSFPALKVGYLTGCRPFIGLDGCHLKGPYRGVLLFAIALDADIRIFPLAFCICEAENYNSWGIFYLYCTNSLGLMIIGL